jgi:hypothetical protein
VVFRDSDHLTNIGEVVIEAVDVPSPSIRPAVPTKITSPYHKAPPGEVVGHDRVSTAVFADSMSYHENCFRLLGRRPSLAVYLRAMRALKTTFRMLPTCARQGSLND